MIRIKKFAWVLLTAIIFIGAGANHFWHPAIYVRITPPVFPHRLALVWISGFFEMLGGAGLLSPALRRAAAWGLLVLLIAVFPANLYMAIDADRFQDLHLPGWGLWLRLPLQGLLIAWMSWIAIHARKSGRGSAGDGRFI
jgi:uncharacterized membrane protein